VTDGGLRIGLMGLNMGPATDPGVARDVAQSAEALGYDSLWVGDHPVLPDPPVDGSPFPPRYAFGAPMVALAHLAAQTSRVLLGTGVLLLAQRNPVHLAKEVATLDRLSGGRMVLGIGVGYLDAEFRAVGVPRDQRGARTDEHLDAMRALWCQPRPAFRGRFTSFDGIEALPTPVRPGGPPIVVGGHSRAALARAARVGDGWLGWFLDPDQCARRVTSLAALPRPEGRPPLEVGVMPSRRLTADLVADYADAGVARIVVTPSQRLDAERLLRFVERNAPAALGLAPVAA
jgi:probable F420-dependent oxidoreductase